MKLPFIPWWYKPKYVGKHRGTYKFWPKVPNVALPYGLRTVKLVPYADLDTTNLNPITLRFATHEDMP